MAGLQRRFRYAFTAAANMAAAMIEESGRIDIALAGNFGARWIEGLHVKASGTIGNMRISMYHDVPYAGIFETGGEIHGNPLLWIPLSFTDAKGIAASEYGSGLFRVDRRASGTPLLFSIADKKPKYFGVESVTIPQKFHLRDIQQSVMGNFRSIFDAAFKGAPG
jgi:hypothetical protein